MKLILSIIFFAMVNTSSVSLSKEYLLQIISKDFDNLADLINEEIGSGKIQIFKNYEWSINDNTVNI